MHSLEAFGPVSTVIGYETHDGDVTDAVAARRARRRVAGGHRVPRTIPPTARTLRDRASPPTTAACWCSTARTHARSTGHGSPVPAPGPRRTRPGRRRRGTRRHPLGLAPHAAHRRAGLAEHAHGRHRRVAHRRRPRHGRDPEFGGIGPVHPFRKYLGRLHIGDAFASGCARSRWRRSRPSPTPRAIRSTPTPTPRPRRRTRSSRASWRTATCWCPGPPDCSWSPRRAPCWPTTGWRALRFITPVAAGDSIRVTLTAKKITPRVTDEYGEVAWDAILHNQNDEIVATLRCADPGGKGRRPTPTGTGARSLQRHRGTAAAWCGVGTRRADRARDTVLADQPGRRGQEVRSGGADGHCDVHRWMEGGHVAGPAAGRRISGPW